jgi:hypothetical protein
MSLNWPKPTINNIPEYQLSGLPFCLTIDNDANNGNTKTGVIEFPRATRWISISAGRKPVDIYFVDDETAKLNDNPPVDDGNENEKHNDQFFIVKADTTTPRLELRCRKLYFSQVDDGNDLTNVTIIAGLTHISKDDCINEELFDWNK